MSETNAFSEYYSGADVFITGATGLIGKATVERLLRCCNKIKTIFILIREKRGKSLDTRLKEFKENSIFNLIRKKNPDVLNKIVGIKGDISEIGLGINQKDLELLKNVSVIFHSAATVRFDEPLKNAIIINVRGTLETLRIAEKLKNLKLFFHVSTAYSNPYQKNVKEELYPPQADWKIFLKAAEKYDECLLNAIWGKFVKFPNTYTFSKHLAEYVVNSYKDRFPVVIFRPAIVANAFKEPEVGWYEGTTGVTGLLAAIGAGVCRTVFCEPHIKVDVVILDVVTLFMTYIPWKETTYPLLKPNENVRIYTVSASSYRFDEIGKLLNLVCNAFERYPTQKSIWLPRLTCTNNYLFFMINFYIFQLLPAIIFDGIIKLTGNRPIVVRVQRKLLTSLNVLQFFICNEYIFDSPRLHELVDELNKQGIYPFDEVFQLSLKEVIDIISIGTRVYVLKEPLDNLKAAKLQYKIRKYVDRIFLSGMFYLLMRRIYSFIQNQWINYY